MKRGIKNAPPVIYQEKARPWMRPLMKGKVDHPVYSTWAMVRAMEHAARDLIQPYLEPGENSVGIEISAQHLAPAALGETILIRAKLKSVKLPIISCRLEAFCGNIKVGQGTHKQFVMNSARYRKFLKNIKAKRTPHE